MPVDFFQLFNFPRQFALDGEELLRRYRALQAAAHPDRFAGKTELEIELARQMASSLNAGFAALKNPLRRAAHLLELNGHLAFAEDNTMMPPDFLEKQLEWREALEEGGAAAAAARGEILQERRAVADETAAALDGENWAAACDAARRWRYLEKLAEELGGEESAAAGGTEK